MPVVGWHASHEQIPPSQLLRDIQLAEQAGFHAAWSSDHITPWSTRQGESGFALSWMGAAMATTAIPVGVVCTPGQRYHPAVMAQALATLAEMFPGRLSAGLGSGEFLNEHVTGDPWPDKATRNARLKESVDVIRALFAGEEVTHHGLVRVDRARLWSLPEQPPRMLALAVSEATARWAAGWADGLVTIWQPQGMLKRIVAAFRENGGEDKPLAMQIHVSWAPDDDEAESIAFDQWRSNVFEPPLCWNLATAEEFDLAAKYVGPEDMYRSVVISSDPARFVECVREAVDLGFDEIYLHHVGQVQQPFIETFGKQVLPALV
ncbi:TIGR03885 family FMN-dependent LLM class oxidoreductase [Kribbella turkmenica]|uniref:TIGR03885 family FMN-dependent LLM class oxidoreductase n=1 Tax=Kribbella turkmenica TaxID=2530375 RepID=A0A4R4X8V1_9ACTN|nr:TIGR03885 family FMN-dependent LLM class oxidoreductase [Kribbella turkmenica]TDD26916.1 TIGR03885 family FMN-dependent LLM class oxidoreductase [Kribbella turkmenica]